MRENNLARDNIHKTGHLLFPSTQWENTTCPMTIMVFRSIHWGMLTENVTAWYPMLNGLPDC